jgi:sterol desaturase/sphingolipid hydroxylase (fatty acid hydroxylase superfamily)
LFLLWLNNWETSVSWEYEDLPSVQKTLLINFIWLIVEDISFALAHRALHTPFLYKHIHKQHHSYTATISIAALYTHPIEHIFGNLVPLTIPGLIMGKHLHFVTHTFIMCRRLVASTIAHAGYNFPGEPSELFPFKAYSAYHDFHHGNNINSNLGGGTVLTDFVMGTNKEYFNHVYKKWEGQAESPSSKEGSTANSSSEDSPSRGKRKSD